MATSARTLTEGYIKIQGENVPINMTATGIRCMTCHQYYNQGQLQKHLISHVNPQFVKDMPVINPVTPEKVSLAAMIEDPEKMDDIWVKSFLPAELPSVQREKKVAQRPIGEGRLLNNEPFLGIGAFQIKSRKQFEFGLGETVDESVHQEQQLNIKKNIKVGKVQNQINKKQIHFYKNEREGSHNIDPIVIRSKNIKDDDTEETDQYSVSRAPQPDAPTSIFTPKKENRQTYRLSSGVKNPANALRITTVSRYEPREAEEVSDLGKSRSTVVGALSRYVPTHNHQSSEHEEHNHTCPCCQGFYCNYCKSSVPPIYRPVPDRDGNYHFHPNQNQQAVEFYRDHYYRSDRNVCTQCTRQMGNGRISEQSGNGRT